jgi:hypothetical protein
VSIKEIKLNELRGLGDRDGLILQGCGGDLQEWVDGINDVLTQDGILLDGTRFSDCVSFRYDNLTCLVFPFAEDVHLNMGKLAMWRIATHGNFGGTWLSDFIDNNLGQAVQKEKPDCALIGQDGNIFNLVGIAARTLRENDMAAEASEMTERITHGAESYDQALGIIGEYVNITGPAEDLDEGPVLED